MASRRQIHVGGVAIGGGAPVVVQSMTTTKTHDAAATLAQVQALADAGCEIVRVAVPGLPDAAALVRIVAESPVPIIADIHFNASLALKAMDAGVAAVRINPGNIGGADKVEQVVRRAIETGTPMRIGANSGSLPEHLRWTATADPAGALVRAAMEEVEVLERLDFHDFKISVKSHVRARDDGRLQAPLRDRRLPAAPGRHRGRHARHRCRQVVDRHRLAARRRASATRSASRSRPTRSRRCASPTRS